MPHRRRSISLALGLAVSQHAFAQAPSASPVRWLSVTGEEGPAGGAGYARVTERNATLSVVFPTNGHRLAAEILGGWTGDNVFCDLVSPCPGKPELVGGAVSLLRVLGQPNGGAPILSGGVGAYRLSEALEQGIRARLRPALVSGFEGAIPTQDGFAITLALHVILMPSVHGGLFYYVPISLGFRMW